MNPNIFTPHIITSLTTAFCLAIGLAEAKKAVPHHHEVQPRIYWYNPHRPCLHTRESQTCQGSS